nr:hypothetical protein [uncultured Desulfobulbus sp.]
MVEMTVGMSSQETGQFPCPSQITSGKVHHKPQSIHDFITQQNSKPQIPNSPFSVIPNGCEGSRLFKQTLRFLPMVEMTVRMGIQEIGQFPCPSQAASGKVRHKPQSIHDFITQQNSKPQIPNLPLSVIPNGREGSRC